MRTYRYTVSTNSIWTSFDYGSVDAESIEEARRLAIQELKSNFEKANDALRRCDSTRDLDFSISFSEGSVSVELDS